jgi:hypothetical protein
MSAAHAISGRWGAIWLRTGRIGLKAGLEIFANFALPYLLYQSAAPRFGEVRALMAAAAPPTLWALAEFARSRRLDAISLLSLSGIALSLLAFLGGGGVRALQLREQIVIAAIGLVFLVSAAIGKPLIYQLARARLGRGSRDKAEAFEALRESPTFRRAVRTMTLAWGASLVGEAALACALVFALPISQYLLVSPILGYAAIGATTAWTFWYARRAIRRALAEKGTMGS